MAGSKIMLIRHGETDWNVEGRIQGFALTALNSNGHAQARALASYLSACPIQMIYSSDLPRAVQTAAPLAQALGLPLQLDERWREVHLGIFEGLTQDESEQRFPRESAARRADMWGFTPSGGESRRALQDRAYEAFQSLVAFAEYGDAAVVSHGGTIKALLLRLFGEDDTRLKAPIDNTSITTLEAVPGGWVLRGLAETPHL